MLQPGLMRAYSGPGLAGDRGCYLLLVRLAKPIRLVISRKVVSLPAGVYGYVGSAQKSLAARVARHLRPPDSKRTRWHIDRLLARAQVEAALVFPLTRPGECWLAERLCKEPGVSLAARGFGSSDCCCPGHLLAFSKPPDLEDLRDLSLPKGLRLSEESGV